MLRVLLRRLRVLVRAVVRRPSNEDTFMADDIVQMYAGATGLLAPEQVIFDTVSSWLEGKAMLDIGVGGGRTTLAFGDVVGRYVGMDYSTAMVDACRSRFAGSPESLTFVPGDVRDMGQFDAESFDFVLFSCNGLDSIEHDDRLSALREIYRVAKPSAYVCFSAHNLRSAPDLFRLNLLEQQGVMARANRLLEWSLLRLINPSPRALADRQFAMLTDGAQHFRLHIYYAAPNEQLSQLRRTGFTDIQIYGEDGTSIPLAALDATRDPWMYYVCRRPD